MSDKLKEQIFNIKLKSRRVWFFAEYVGFKTPDEFLDNLAQNLSDGAEVVELSGANMTDREFLETAKKTKQLCEVFGATFLVKNRADIAYLSSADGVNLEQEDIDTLSVLEIFGEKVLIGLYINTNCAEFSVKGGADYIIRCNTVSTPTEPVKLTGLEYAKWVSENTLLPVVCWEKEAQ